MVDDIDCVLRIIKEECLVEGNRKRDLLVCFAVLTLNGNFDTRENVVEDLDKLTASVAGDISDSVE